MATTRAGTKKKSIKPHMLPNLLIFGLLRSPRNAADSIHRAYIFYYWRQCRSIRDYLAVLKGFLLSPLKIVREIRARTRRHGPAAAAVTGKPLWRQRLEQFYLAFFFSINPENYYIQEFYRDDGLKRARNFFIEKTLKAGLYRLLSSYGSYLHRETSERYSMERKLDFFNFCLQKGLSTVPVLMQFMADGTVHDFRQNSSSPGELPEEDLFCKPDLDNRGRRAEIWYWKGEQSYVNTDGETLSSRKLMKRLTALARRHRYKSFLVQPLVLPHPDLEPFRKRATPTVRIITYTALDGVARVGRAMLRFSASSRAIVDNASAGGAVAPIDLDRGALGPAVAGGSEQIGRRMSFLDNGFRIEGYRIPYWKETLELVLRVHRYFPQHLVVGWDVIITEKGPLLLEGNSQPGVCFIQRAHLQPLGQTEAGEVMAAHCQNALATLYSGQLGRGESGETIDLFSGSRLRRCLSWLPGGNVRAVHLVISGKVQRVFYRRWLQREAREKGLSGWVRNRFDGTVEAVLRGRAFDIEDLVHLAWLGPPRARVRSIQINWYRGSVGRGFKILKSV